MSDAPPQSAAPDAKVRLRVGLYAITIFVSAFLLFQIQPLIGRIVLPMFGGVASVWTACMLFFQALLLLGYFYAHWTTQWLPPRASRIVHLALLLASIAALLLGLTASPGTPPGGDPTWAVLQTLTLLVGLPYLTLSTTGPLLQAWFATEIGRLPYRLFALSNLGSMVALLTYPLIVEPRLALNSQVKIWSVGFVLFCVLTAALAHRRVSVTGPAEDAGHESAGLRPGSRTVLTWTLLAFCPSVLLLAITRHVTDEVAPIPLLWIGFLSIYLLSFILCFESERWYRRALFVPATFAVLILTAAALFNKVITDVSTGIVLFALALFAASMTCHGELARRKPHPAHLTAFYLWVSVGGVLGGIFVGLLAPKLFNDYYELPIGIALTVLVIAVLMRSTDFLPRAPRTRSALRIGMLAFTLFVSGGLLYAAWQRNAHVTLLQRNFYGKLLIKDERPREERQRVLYHGGTIHGMEMLAADRRMQPTTYYTEASGVGRAILATRSQAPQRVGVIGLGAGTLAAYGRPGDVYRFYDINPLVMQVAQRWFFFLAGSAGKVELVLGDARLSLQQEQVRPFDVLVVDAFSGDSIPVHLLTREAMALYFSHLKEDGILAVHVSNRYLNLAPVLAAHVDAMLKAGIVFDVDDDPAKLQYGSTWVLLANSAITFAREGFKGREELKGNRRARQWTDDYSSVLQMLK